MQMNRLGLWSPKPETNTSVSLNFSAKGHGMETFHSLYISIRLASEKQNPLQPYAYQSTQNRHSKITPRPEAAIEVRYLVFLIAAFLQITIALY
jgi:hypothetical protein